MAAIIDLGTACGFAVLAGTPDITNTGNTVISGTGNHVGISPAASVIGFPPGIVVPPGTIHLADGAAAQAKLDLTAAFIAANLLGPGTAIPAGLGGTTRTPGVYSESAGTFNITGTLTLDGGGNPDAEFVFIASSTLITASGPGAAIVSLINGAQAKNVYWIVNSSATIGTFTVFVGNILALTSITTATSASVNGKLLARNGTVTLDTNAVTSPSCASSSCPTITFDPSSLPSGRIRRIYDITVTASGGTAPYTYTLISGSLPTGATLNSSTGQITGFITESGQFDFTIAVTDSDLCENSQAYTIMIYKSGRCVGCN